MAAHLPRLGVNIDHLATLRQLRGTPYPDLIEAVKIIAKAGGQQITVHLREDRRHIQDADVFALRKLLSTLGLRMNLEMAVSDPIIRIALAVCPDWVCLVPEKRQEVTTEGGLDVAKQFRKVAAATHKLKQGGIQVSLFIEPSLDAVRKSKEVGADAVELHTGRFCLAAQAGKTKAMEREQKRIEQAAKLGRRLGLHVHAGHGFDYENVKRIASQQTKTGEPLIEEYNIGHSIICRAAIVGLKQAVSEMSAALQRPLKGQQR